MPQGSVLGPVLFLVYCADVIAIARRCGTGIHSYADDSQRCTFMQIRLLWTTEYGSL